ncbi:MAG: hypothetical protein HYY00_05090 [Chloroflexi bacterium]|nr:hypothetical protein [Chloroflexota bacterium]
MRTARWMPRYWGATVVLFLLAGMASAACARQGAAVPSATQTPGQALARSLTLVDEGGGGVTVEATWVTEGHLQEMPQTRLEGYPLERYALVHVKLDTHSGDLAGYDMARVAALSVGGGPPVQATLWVGLEDSGHHREGALVFPEPGSEGGQVEMVLREIAGVPERAFRWEF